MKPRQGYLKLKQFESLEVTRSGVKVGDLYREEGRGIFFAYDPGWLATGFNLSPFTMKFDDKPQLALDPDLFDGLHGPFADSLPDGWGMLLMDRFLNSTFGDGTAYTVNALDRLAYMSDKAMGAFEYHPRAEREELRGTVDLAELFEASVEVLSGETSTVLSTLRLAGGSPGGARPKAIVAMSADGNHATSAFGQIPSGYDHWIVKFRAPDEPVETGAIEYAYYLMARDAGVEMADSKILNMTMPDGSREGFFATKRFDREGDKKLHMITVSALMYASYKAPSMDYSGLLKLTNMLTRSAKEVEKMARVMVFNALFHNYDDHTKNFAFIGREPEKPGEAAKWALAPAYDLTFSEARGEHTTAYSGRGKATRQLIMELCADYKYLKPRDYIEQTLMAFAKWDEVFRGVKIPLKAGAGYKTALEKDHTYFNLIRPTRR
jgi:serine/threonine-protein kinase HipA